MRETRAEHTLDESDVLAVHEKQDDVIAGLDPGVVVSDQNLVVPDDRARGNAIGKIQLSQFAPDHPGRCDIAVHDRLHRFGGAAAQ